MFLVRLAVDRPVLATVLILSIVVFGAFSFMQLSQDLFPKIDFPIIVITTVYPGAGPKEVESQVTEILEEEVGAVGGLRKMESQSLENISLIVMEFELEVDGNIAKIDVKDKVDIARMRLPREIEPPVVEQFDINSEPVLTLAINSDRPLTEITKLAETRIKDELSKINGVSKVEVIGGLEREILVACNADKLRSYGLSLMDVVGYVQAENLNFPSGQITGITSEYSLRLTGEFKSLNDIRMMRIITPSGAVIHLQDVAEIKDAWERPAEQARFQGHPAVTLSVQQSEDANTVLISRAVRNRVEKLSGWFKQERIEVTVANDRAKYITNSINDVLTNIIIGIILTSILLYLFLHDFRSTLIVAISMPSSIIATFSLIFFAGFSINMISLMALGISIGVLVTNNIIVLENISNKLRQGKDSRTAAVEGTGEIAIAVVASTLTNVMVFTPIAFMKGMVGRIFFQFGLTVVFATIIALLISFTLTPMMAKLFLKTKKDQRKALKANGNKINLRTRFANAWDRFYEELANDYRSVLNWILTSNKRKGLIVFCSSLALFVGVFLLGKSGMEFFPESDEGIIKIEAKLPPGTSLEQTDRTLQLMSKAVANIKEVNTVLSQIGGTGKGINEGRLIINLVEIENRNRKTADVMNEMRPLMASIPAAQINLTMGSGRGPGSGIEIEIIGPELETINEISNKAMNIGRNISGVIDIRSTYETGKPELAFIPNRNQMADYGITSIQVGSVLRTAFEGQEITYFREAGEDYDIRVQLIENERSDLSSFGDMLIRTPKGYVPISQLGEIKYSQSETKIERKNKQRVVKVNANTSGITIGDAADIWEKNIKKEIIVPSGYDINFGGTVEFMKREFGYIFQALILAIILTYMVLAGILEDFTHPFTIMTTLPLGLVGVGIGLFIAGVSINMMSLMAIVMLVGIVVNNAILILDYAKQLRQKGMEKVEALVESSYTRLRPIIMTNLAIAISVLPQALGGAGSEFRRALAVVTMGGVLFSAVFTLILIPAIYTWFDRFAFKIKVENENRENY